MSNVPHHLGSLLPSLMHLVNKPSSFLSTTILSNTLPASLTAMKIIHNKPEILLTTHPYANTAELFLLVVVSCCFGFLAQASVSESSFCSNANDSTPHYSTFDNYPSLTASNIMWANEIMTSLTSD